MLRTLLGAFAGYVFMALFLIVTFSLLWFVLGADFAFQPGTLEVTSGWILLSIPVSLLAAVLGGWMAAHIGRSPKAVTVLALVVLVLGVASAVLQLQAPALSPAEQAEILARVETGEVGNVAVGQYARQPAWFALLLPLLGAGGAMAGGRLRLRDGG